MRSQVAVTFLISSNEAYFKNLSFRNSFMVNGDHSNSNGTPSKKEAIPSTEAKPSSNANENNPDSIEDELDAEMPEITSNKSVIEDEMVTEAVVVEEIKKDEIMEAESRLNEPTSSSMDEASNSSEAEAGNEAAVST